MLEGRILRIVLLYVECHCMLVIVFGYSDRIRCCVYTWLHNSSCETFSKGKCAECQDRMLLQKLCSHMIKMWICKPYVFGKKKGSPVHVAPACAGSGEGSDHFGSFVRIISLHFCKRLFPGLEPVTSWSQGGSSTAAPRLFLLLLLNPLLFSWHKLKLS